MTLSFDTKASVRFSLSIIVALTFCCLAWASTTPSSTEMNEARCWASAAFEGIHGSKLPCSFAPFFSFTYGGKESTELLETWKLNRVKRELDANRIEHTLTYTDMKTGLVVRCVGIEYRDFPVVEWTLYFKNTSDKETPILADIQAIDIHVPRAETLAGKDSDFCLHYHAGGEYTPSAYRPLKTTLMPGSCTELTGTGGRPTDNVMPYFNLQQPDGSSGLITVVGWPGQWAAQFIRDQESSLQIRAGQELTHFKLLPGEEVRTPLIVLQFWKGNRIRSQNIWRRWMLAHNVPRLSGMLPSPMLAASSSWQYDIMASADTASQIFFIDRYLQEKIKLDYWWMDAGWYPCDKIGWHKTGTWEVDTRRFPNGLREVSNHAHAQGVKTILWFEPERVHSDTWLTKNHPEWILGGEKGGLLDLGNTDAWKWLINHVDKLLVDEGIDLYRQDFNVEPLGYWRGNDAKDRQGITEIKHVVGYLAFWDELRRRHPDMLIDTCASGGRRNDLETLRRSLPLLRSDFLQANQECHTYGIASWIPYFGTTMDMSDDGYTMRTVLCPEITCNFDMRVKDADFTLARAILTQWQLIAPCFFGDYYPLTPYSLDQSQWLGWQFDCPEKGEGMIQLFRRQNCLSESICVKLHGLDPEATYTLTNLDLSNTRKISGCELMEKGLSVTIQERRGAAIFTYVKKPL